MKSILPLLALVLACYTNGCAAWRHGPGFSMYDSYYFMEPPQVVKSGETYLLRWRYGKWGFFFFPESRVKDGALVFSLQATTSSGSLSGTTGQVKIEGKDKIRALERGGAYWWEPDGRKIQLDVLPEKS